MFRDKQLGIYRVDFTVNEENTACRLELHEPSLIDLEQWLQHWILASKNFYFPYRQEKKDNLRKIWSRNYFRTTGKSLLLKLAYGTYRYLQIPKLQKIYISRNVCLTEFTCSWRNTLTILWTLNKQAKMFLCTRKICIKKSSKRWASHIATWMLPALEGP